MAEQTISVSEALRRAVRDSGESVNEISRRAKVNQAALSRFMRGERGLTSPSIDRLAKCLGLELTRKACKPDRSHQKGGPSRNRPPAPRRDRD